MLGCGVLHGRMCSAWPGFLTCTCVEGKGEDQQLAGMGESGTFKHQSVPGMPETPESQTLLWMWGAGPCMGSQSLVWVPDVCVNKGQGGDVCVNKGQG